MHLRFLIAIMLLSLCVACASNARQSPILRSNQRIDRPLNRGTDLYLQGCYARALEYFLEAHERYAAIDDLPGIASSLNSIANVYYQLDDAQSAVRVYSEALDAYRQLKDPDGTIRVLANQAVALARAGQLNEAERLLDQADALAGATRRLLPLRLKNRALLAMARGQTAAAETMLREALTAGGAHDQGTQAAAHHALGRLLIDAGRPLEAEPHLQEALATDRSLGAFQAVAKDLSVLGACYAELGDHAAAVNCFQRSIKIYALLQDTVRVQEMMVSLKESADQAGTDIQPAQHWIDEWLAGRTEATLCR